MIALRADQWLENHPDDDDATRRAFKQHLRDAFYPTQMLGGTKILA